MCGSCEPKMGKAGMGLGVLFMVLAAVSRLAHFYPASLGPRSFAAAAALMFLMAIAANTTHSHDHAA